MPETQPTFETESDVKKDSVVTINREKYVTSRTASGAKSLSNGDGVAKLLEGMTVAMLYSITDKAFKDNEFKTKYAKLNHGMQRMNLGNRLRGFVTKRDLANNIAKDKGEDLKASGADALAKWCEPFRKEVNAIMAKADEKKAGAKAKAGVKAK